MAVIYNEALGLYIFDDTENNVFAMPDTGNANVLGNALANEIGGNDGNNILDGGAGADELTGGKGDDTYVVDDGGDVVTEGPDAGAGHDKVISLIAGNYVLTANVEDLVLGTGALNGGGNGLDNVITGNGLANVIAGDDGDDSLYGGAGVDDLTGGIGDDFLDGGAGADNLMGGDGNDVLDGGDGVDVMTGGKGDDTYFVNDAGETAAGGKLVEVADEGTDTVVAFVSHTLAANFENLTLSGTADLNGTGNDAANMLVGNAGKNELTGGKGNDTLDGGNGADKLDGGEGDDTYRVTAGDTIADSGGIDTVVSAADWTLGTGLEKLMAATGTAALKLTGNELANAITGNAGDNVLTGGAGADTMAGGSGNDTYMVDNALDMVSEAASGGNDKVITSVSFALAVTSQVESIEAAQATSTSGLSLTGSNSDNVVRGTAGKDKLSGLDGADKLFGGAGADNLRGGTGKDIFNLAGKLGKTNIDSIVDFVAKDDTVELDRKMFTKLKVGKLASSAFYAGTKAHDSNDRIVYDAKTGKLWYDDDGSGSHAAVQFAVLSNHAKGLTAADFIVV